MLLWVWVCKYHSQILPSVTFLDTTFDHVVNEKIFFKFFVYVQSLWDFSSYSLKFGKTFRTRPYAEDFWSGGGGPRWPYTETGAEVGHWGVVPGATCSLVQNTRGQLREGDALKSGLGKLLYDCWVAIHNLRSRWKALRNS